MTLMTPPEGVVLGVHAAGEHVDRLHGVEGEVHGEGAGDRVGDVHAVDQVAVVAGLAALDVGVGAAADARHLLGGVLVGAAPWAAG